MKRWFISLVCLVLVFSMVVPPVALAASSTLVDLSGYLVGTTDYGTYQLTNYKYDAVHFGKVSYYSESFTHSITFQTDSYSFDFSLADSSFSVVFDIAFADHTYFGGSCWNGFEISSCNSVENFKQGIITFHLNIYSTVATTCKITPCFLTLFSGGIRNRVVEGATTTVNLEAGIRNITSPSITISSTTLSSDEVAIVPFIHVTFPNPPSSGSVLVTSEHFKYDVKTAEDMAQYPAFTQNLSGTYTYLKGEESGPLSVSASVSDGGALNYKWYANTTPSTDGGSYCGTGKSCYPSTTLTGTYYYYCVVTNTANGKTSSSTSNLATVHVINPPKSPQISQNLGSGTVEYTQGAVPSPLVISAITSDDGELSYQWYSNNEASAEGGSPIAGAVSSSYLPSTSVIGINYYYCVVTNTISGYTATATSNVAAIRVVSPPDPAAVPVITVDLSTEEVVYETGTAAAALRIGAESPDGGELTYQWYSMSGSGGQGVLIPGANTASYTPETVVAGTTYYYCIVINSLNDSFAKVTSKVAMITVQDPPPETTPPQLDEMNDKLDHTNNFLENIVQGIVNLPQNLLEGIKGLFVPDAESMAAYQDQWSELLADRFGAIYESVAVIDDFISSIDSSAKQEEVTFPSITVDLAGTPWTFGGWSVDIVPDNFAFLTTYSKLIVNIICTFAFVNGLRNKFESILGGR